MNILLLGSGAREHALARALAHAPETTRLVVAPGNPGTASIATNIAVDPTCATSVVELARSMEADLVVVGPEAPLVAGVADAVREAGFPCFGPGKEAAQLEGSKAFAKEIMEAAQVPTAGAYVCTTMDQVEQALEDFGAPYVVKDDGLAAGKGVVVTEDRQEALDHASACLSKEHGAVLIEDYLDGPEISLFCVCDGTRVYPLAPAQDFKRHGENNTGPNTGGMGAYSPLTWAPEDIGQQVVEKVAQPVVDEMARRGTPFIGLLYCGLAMTSRGMKVVEFNVRFGDPETQAVLARLQSSLPELLLAAAEGKLDEVEPPAFSHQAAVDVVLAAPGYPANAITGGIITGIEEAEKVEGVHVLHAGTVRDDDDNLISAGGRVLSIVALGDCVTHARERAYEALNCIDLPGGYARRDIAAGR
ncbi:phosphoribosylamine--glycine ligase [Actinomyces vulturis]|uniref:phosphoribosylamine--glycine ligase n=1 Tax=Actinomyces vulturis TaxID=1857645 RepID=UPI0008323C3A|nr:phosphoribosylamine--glycine ligase [Actinomyces vulturis]